MSDIDKTDRKIAEWLGYKYLDGDPTMPIFEKSFTDTIWPGNLRAWLLSPPGTVAMQAALLRDKVEFHSWVGGTSDKIYFSIVVNLKKQFGGDSTDLSTAVYEAVKKYLEESIHVD